jgi:predicted MFS family arabinose efflux permease
MIPDYFGRTHQGSIRGAITPLMVIVSSLGAPLGGYLLDSGMSYPVFFWGVLVAVVIASSSFFFQKPPTRLRARIDVETRERVAL